MSGAATGADAVGAGAVITGDGDDAMPGVVLTTGPGAVESGEGDDTGDATGSADVAVGRDPGGATAGDEAGAVGLATGDGTGLAKGAGD